MADGQQEGGRRRRLGVGAVVVLGLGALALTVGAGILRGATAPQEDVPLPTGTAVASGQVFVHVSGAVRAPGLYRLNAGSRVVDAIAAAGGFAPEADRAALNLARDVKDGEQLLVAVAGAAPPAAPGGRTTGSGPAPPGPGGRVNLNTADASQLDTLPRIGPAIAQRIVDWRAQNGSFTSVDDLLEVPGIGEKLLAGIRDQVTV